MSSTKNYRQEFESYFVEDNRIEEERKIEVSPSGKYKLIIDVYKGQPTHVTRGVVKRIEEETVVADVKRSVNYFFYYWVTHPNGNEYLLCAESYVEYVVINLSKEIVSQSFIPGAKDQAFQLIWYNVHPSPDKMVLAIYGILWGYKTEVRFYDFSSPDEAPLKELGKSQEWGDVTVVGWEDNNTFVFSTDRWRRLSDNKSVTELSMDEIHQLDDEPDLYPSDTFEEIVKWHRGV
jgi:hypothetical protein